MIFLTKNPNLTKKNIIPAGWGGGMGGSVEGNGGARVNEFFY